MKRTTERAQKKKEKQLQERRGGSTKDSVQSKLMDLFANTKAQKRDTAGLSQEEYDAL